MPPLTAILPDWLRDMVCAHLTRELAHGEDSANVLRLSDSDLDGLPTARGVTPVWTLDGISDAPSGAPIQYPYQGFNAQTANALLEDWPHTAVWWLFATGAVVRLDGGRFDISVVRDSVLNATNDYETFVEPFASLMYLGGPEVLQVASAMH